jgi:hypothetical protein
MRDKPEPVGPGLHERVIQRAESIRSRWNVAIPPRPTDVTGTG